MKAAAAGVALLLAATPAGADLVGVVPLEHGAELRLFDEQGICVGNARRASYERPGAAPVAGCWVIRGAAIAVVFLDADVGMVPAAAVRKPTVL